MSAQAYHFDAFISYRHTDRDKKIVDTIQKLAENYRSPCDGAHIKKGERIQRIFTDRSELPMSADLGGSITQALAQSRFLVVIASPEYMLSRWCMTELITFLRLNQYSTDRILFVQVDGAPSCVAEILQAAGICVTSPHFREPLYINACAQSTKESIKIVKQEHLRLAAVLIGCGYDALYQRHKRAKIRRILLAACLSALTLAAVGTVLAIQSAQKQRETDYRTMDASISDICDQLRAEDRVEALEAMQELYQEHESYADYLAEQLQFSAIEAAYVPAASAFSAEAVPYENAGIAVSSDGNYVIAFDLVSARADGNLAICLYDAYLHKLSEHVLPVQEWKDQLALGYYFETLRIDYLEADDIFVLELLSDDPMSASEVTGIRTLFSADGELLQQQELTDIAQPPLEVRELYQQFPDTVNHPVCLSSDCLYTVLTEGDSPFEPFGATAEPYRLISMSASGQTALVATLSRTSDRHALDSLSVTDDGRFVLVKETRGIYNDVLTLCDAEGLYHGITIDLGENTVQGVQYRFDEDTQEAIFVFNLWSAEGEAGTIAQCRVADGQLLNCEMYPCKIAYNCLLSKSGYVYMIDDASITAIATQNMCLAERLAGITEEPAVRTGLADNDLIEDPNAFSVDSTARMTQVRADALTITPEASRVHQTSPVFSTGVDIGIGICDSAGDEIVQFFSGRFCHAYYNEDDGIFGLIDYSEPENSEAFRLHDFDHLMELLA